MFVVNLSLALCSPCILTLIFSFSTNKCTFYFRSAKWTVNSEVYLTRCRDDGRVAAETYVGCSEQKITKVKSAFVG
jgi:hypothetical protein